MRVDECADDLASAFTIEFMPLGFLGAGAITASIVTGLNTGVPNAPAMILSPRNAEVAAALVAQFPNVSIASSNQALLDAAETVVLAVRPQVAEAIVNGLQFRPGHHVLSVISGFNVDRLRRLVAPATRITRAVPLPAAARRRSPTAIYPPDREAIALFSQTGDAFAVDSEPAFDAFCTVTATMATYFGFASATADWLARHQIPAQQARDYVAAIFAGLSEAPLRFPRKSFADLSAEHATKGGTNEQVLRHMTQARVFETYSDALDGILRRVTGEPPKETVDSLADRRSSST